MSIVAADVRLILALVERFADGMKQLVELFRKPDVTEAELDALDAQFDETVRQARETIAAKRAEIAARSRR